MRVDKPPGREIYPHQTKNGELEPNMFLPQRLTTELNLAVRHLMSWRCGFASDLVLVGLHIFFAA